MADYLMEVARWMSLGAVAGVVLGLIVSGSVTMWGRLRRPVRRRR